MRENIPSLLWAWALLSPILFRLIPGRDAAIACLIGGWAFLPNAAYPASSFATGLAEGTGGSAHALAVPAWPIPSKSTAIGLGCLAGLALFDRRAFARPRFDVVDLPMAAWCLVPVASAIANGLPIAEGLAQSRYLLLAWGVPYAIGRAYLADAESHRRFALGLVAAGLLYLPFCLIEIIKGPMLYHLVYGAHPYQVEGAARLVGYRPMVFLEHGNQLGMWMASSAVAATWLRFSGAALRPWGIPGEVLAATLVVATILCQSLASILYMAAALLPMLAGRLPARAWSWRLAVIGALVMAGLAVTLLAARRGFDPAALRVDARDFFHALRKGSFTWRLARSQDFLPVAMHRPILGWARPDWGPGGRPFLNPVNLGFWLLAFGMYGVVGLAASTAAWLAPAVRAIPHLLRGRRWLGPAEGASGALAALLVIHAIDGLTNAVMILPLLAAAGGLNRPARTRPDRA
jgi:hypothetical protein